MIAENETANQTCQKLFTAYFNKYPNAGMQIEADRILICLSDFPLLKQGKPGGWAGGIIYALTNHYRRACGIHGLLNKECEAFFGASMETIRKRAATIKDLLFIRDKVMLQKFLSQ